MKVRCPQNTFMANNCGANRLLSSHGQVEKMRLLGLHFSLGICFTETAEPITFLLMCQVTFDIIVTADADPNSLDRIRYAVGNGTQYCVL